MNEYRNSRLQYDPSEKLGTERRPMRGQITPWTICTAHVERNNPRSARLWTCFAGWQLASRGSPLPHSGSLLAALRVLAGV